MLDRQQDRRQVAWDLETTGFGWNDKITVSGFWLPTGQAELIINTSGDNLDSTQAESYLEDVSSGVPVSVTVVDDERALLAEMQRVLFDRFDREYNRLVAYNAETWKSGFDLPFLRTCCLKHSTNWVFDNIQYGDLWEPIKKRLNTTHTKYGNSNAVNSLTGAHEILLNHAQPATILAESDVESHTWYRDAPYDPFDDSGSAVRCYKQGEYLPILQHNLSDVHRTWELGELVRAYVPPKDVTTKKL